VTAVLPDGGVAYDGRATKEENWFERTALAARDGSGRMEATSEGPVLEGRYLEVLPLPDGSARLFWESRRADGSHELRTDVVPAGPGQDAA
jgi:hypothetical protein